MSTVKNNDQSKNQRVWAVVAKYLELGLDKKKPEDLEGVMVCDCSIREMFYMLFAEKARCKQFPREQVLKYWEDYINLLSKKGQVNNGAEKHKYGDMLREMMEWRIEYEGLV